MKGSVLLFTSTYEDAAVALEQRRRSQPCSYMNPTGENEEVFRGCQKTVINPVGPYWLGNRKTRGVRAAKIAAGKVPPDDSTKDRYWDLSARGMDRALTLCEVELFPDRATIPRVARRTLDDPIAFMKWAYKRVKSPEVRDMAARWVRAGVNEVRSVQEVIQNLQTHVEMFVEPIFADCLRWDLMRIGRLRQVPQTLVIANPICSMGGDGADHFMASILEWALAELQSPQFNGNVPVAIVIDELRQYPKSDALLASLTSLRKYNCFVVMGVNDPTYFAKYGKDAPVFENEAALRIWLQAKSKEASEQLSHMLGETEVETYQKNVNWSPGYDWNNPSGMALQKGVHASESHSLSKKPLLLPHEIRELSGRSIVFMDGVPGPILAEPRGYFKIPWLRKRAGKNPFWKG